MAGIVLGCELALDRLGRLSGVRELGNADGHAARSQDMVLVGRIRHDLFSRHTGVDRGAGLEENIEAVEVSHDVCGQL